MALISMTFRWKQFALEEFTKDFHKKFKAVYKESVKEFYRTAISRIPVRTGFAAGAVDALGAALQITVKRPGLKTAKRTGAAKGIKRSSGREILSNEFYYYPGGRILKSNLSGRQFATPKDEIFKITDEELKLSFRVTIRYFSIQDVQNIKRSRTAPWLAFESGKLAMNKYLMEHVKEMVPDIEKYFKRVIHKTDV